MAIEYASDTAKRLIGELGRKYIWWAPISDVAPTEERVIAQVMNLGTFDDIRRLEKVLGLGRLADVMRRAEPGWFSDRSWEFWRGRLSRALDKPMPEEPPRRSLDAAVL